MFASACNANYRLSVPDLRWSARQRARVMHVFTTAMSEMKEVTVMSLLMIPLAMFFVAVMVWAGCQLRRMTSRHSLSPQ